MAPVTVRRRAKTYPVITVTRLAKVGAVSSKKVVEEWPQMTIPASSRASLLNALVVTHSNASDREAVLITKKTTTSTIKKSAKVELTGGSKWEQT
jgi:hypothetical protein